jgi:hypothetical protein
VVIIILQTIKLVVRHNPELPKETRVTDTVLLYIRWLLQMIKDRKSVSPDIVMDSFEILQVLAEALDGRTIDSFLPQLSSVITKVLGNDYRPASLNSSRPSRMSSP